MTTTTDGTTFALGKPVEITVTIRNAGSACIDSIGIMGGCWQATAYDSAGQAVWQNLASPTNAPTACPADLIGGTVKAGFKMSSAFTWDQKRCIYGSEPFPQVNPDCPESPVAAGAYEIVGQAGVRHSTPVEVRITA